MINKVWNCFYLNLVIRTHSPLKQQNFCCFLQEQKILFLGQLRWFHLSVWRLFYPREEAHQLLEQLGSLIHVSMFNLVKCVCVIPMITFVEQCSTQSVWCICIRERTCGRISSRNTRHMLDWIDRLLYNQFFFVVAAAADTICTPRVRYTVHRLYCTPL